MLPRTTRDAIFAFLRHSGIPTLLRATVQRSRVTVLVYHDPSAETFARHLQQLRRLYNVVPLRDVARAVLEGTWPELPRRALVLTFDDGHCGNRGLLPVLERERVPITIFLCTRIAGTRRGFWFKHVDNAEDLRRCPDSERLRRLHDSGFDEDADLPVREALSEDEIVAMMQSGFVDFQAHTQTHPALPFCSDEKARRELCQARDDLAAAHRIDVYAVAYPNGLYGPRETALAASCGYVCALTTDRGYNSRATDPFRLKRIGIGDQDPIDALVVKASGLWSVFERGRKMLHRRRR
jgi:peptidoglycan/xylan/chitin deacetylase (PgdA/CDA1 family)